CGEEFDHFTHVLVGAFAGQNFVADDDQAKVRAWGGRAWMVHVG
ncbi:MAG: hypothetical protein RL657_2447, partial [Pseudomonadota bacterium]